MKTGRFSEPQILSLSCARQKAACPCAGAMPGTRDERRLLLQVAFEVWRHGRLDDQPDEGPGGREPSAEEDVCRDEHAARTAEEALGKVYGPPRPCKGSRYRK